MGRLALLLPFSRLCIRLQEGRRFGFCLGDDCYSLSGGSGRSNGLPSANDESSEDDTYARCARELDLASKITALSWPHSSRQPDNLEPQVVCVSSISRKVWKEVLVSSVMTPQATSLTNYLFTTTFALTSAICDTLPSEQQQHLPVMDDPADDDDGCRSGQCHILSDSQNHGAVTEVHEEGHEPPVRPWLAYRLPPRTSSSPISRRQFYQEPPVPPRRPNSGVRTVTLDSRALIADWSAVWLLAQGRYVNYLIQSNHYAFFLLIAPRAVTARWPPAAINPSKPLQCGRQLWPPDLGTGRSA
ncbi:uncharacterized protein CLUP02_00916 [Colletotrichum lupini]|uniref:Uncharacterized protein n=1 Tax=Colletotrichum lupini TaxID=145971 RepID=A0A9Q8SC01_9PEZI|nr:uncharacterized protein CLUP02_00916 [Colletotrichum lupini]UQC74268.1 hypothetical protein CLUP02_00916 [Colletotrichum lupini]